MPDENAKAAIEAALQDGRLRCRSVVNTQLANAPGNDLDKGEAEAIALATEIHAYVLLMDEMEAPNLARQAGVRVRGVLGVLVRAKAAADIASAKSELEAFRSRASFFIAPSLEAEILRSVGE